MVEPKVLGNYLRARRALVSPEEAGLPSSTGRRIPGLRREEVATLAGISVDYYTRLEKGQDQNPSAQVLAALARVLKLDPTATRYLQSLPTVALARDRPPVDRPRDRSPVDEDVPVGCRLLLQAIELPAFVESRVFDVLAANAQARALSPMIRPGLNRLRSVFLDRKERDLHPDWEQESVRMVAEFRESVGTDLANPRVAELVGELSEASEVFARAWGSHDVNTLTGVASRLLHPKVGLVTLRREDFPVMGTTGQLLVIYFAEPGSEDVEKLRRIGAEA